MSLPININVDITDKVSIPGALHLACSVYLPDPANLPDCPTVIFAVPGGGYTRHYYDLQLPGHEHYSEAQYHRQRGTVFISCDHLGVGESSVPDPTLITFEVLAAAYAATVTELVGRIKKRNNRSPVPRRGKSHRHRYRAIHGWLRHYPHPGAARRFRCHCAYGIQRHSYRDAAAHG